MAQSHLAAVVAALFLWGSATHAVAQTPPAKKAAPAKKTAKKPAAPPPLPAADSEQLDAADKVYYGRYDCEFGKTVQLDKSIRDTGYVELHHGKLVYVMKPAMSSTGALRLEDVKGKTLMVQIAAKSMLMDVKAGRRIVDECVSPSHREATERAKAASGPTEGLMSGAVPAEPPASAASAPNRP